MRNISFALTTAAVRHGFATGEIQKDVTRRLGWRSLKVSEYLCACEKCQGLGKGGKIVRLGKIRVVSVGIQRLDEMTRDPTYGFAEVKREGFPDMWPSQFVEMFCSHNACTPATVITRIEFAYVR